MTNIKVFMVDDQILFVESLKMVIDTRANDIEVVGIANNGKEAIEAIKVLQPDIVLMDVRMPVMDGVETTRIIHREYPGIQIIMLTTFDDDEYVHNALQYGAVGYLLKDIPPNELIAAVRAVKEGSVLISPSVATKLVDSAYHIKKPGHNLSDLGSSKPNWIDFLTEQEKKVLKLLSQGLNNSEIAEELLLAEQTVKNYVSCIYSKLGARDRVQAMKLGIDAHLDSNS